MAAPRALRWRDLYLGGGVNIVEQRRVVGYDHFCANVPILQNDVLAAPEIWAQFRFARDSDVVFPFVVCRTWARRGNTRRDGRKWAWGDEFLDAMTTNGSRSRW